ncbi:MAG: zinc metalloprotease HtpX [Candidatus Diapherotrites archaeon]
MEFQLRTVFFLGVLTALFLAIGYYVGGMGGMIVAFFFAAILNIGSYFFSDKIVLAMYRATPVDTKTNQGSRIYGLVQRVASKMHLPLPKVCTIEQSSPNAFATGRNPHHAAIVFTTGILSLLNDDELEGVIAHELSHVKNRDILIASMAATIAGAIGMLAHSLTWIGMSGRDDNRNVVGMILIAITIPIVATLVQLAVSRSREYLADETAAHALHSGSGLASALKKLEKGIQRTPFTKANEGTAHLFIANPFSANGIIGLFATHPPIQDRIKRLESRF